MKIYLLVKIIKSNLWLRRDPGDEAQRGQGVVGPTGPEDGFRHGLKDIYDLLCRQKSH